MKKILIFISLFLSFGFTYATDIEDNSIIEELNESNTQKVDVESFKLNKFSSCESLEKVTNNFLKDYKDKYGSYYYRGGGIIMEDMAVDSISGDSSNLVSKTSDFSQTNEQVKGVSESELIKTDGKYIYYVSDYYDYNNSDYESRQNKKVFIIDSEKMTIVKKINLPSHFYGTEIYLQGDRLVIISTGYPTGKFQSTIWDNSQKTYTIIYDVSNPLEAKMIKAFMSEGSFSKSRLIDDKLYVISNKDINNMISLYSSKENLNSTDIVPKGLEMIYTEDADEQNIEIDGKNYDYKYQTGYVSGCDSIEYILPDNDDSLGLPSFNLVSIIDIENIEEEVNTKVIFGNLAEIYMSLDSLYLTNYVNKSSAFACPFGARCIMPYYYGSTNHTLIHKMEINDFDLDYKSSALVEGSPLTQYSMDEHNGNFRILTSTSRWNSSGEDSHTDLYVLDKNLELKSSLQNLGAGEDFKSSRFMGDKLFLVTFEQIDPLFVIDLSDDSNPKILGELKMPGYSTYLHPYDENHIIGIGYDTAENQYGNIQNSGVKVDLYEIDYDRKPESKDNSGDIYVAQKFTKTFGGYGSYSEALNNPRMFMWNTSKNDLFLPITLKVSDSIDTYKTIDFFQGLISINIDKNTGIKENYKFTHMDESMLEKDRDLECNKYTSNNEETCVTLLNGELYCKPKTNIYVPTYCYEGSTLGEYISSKSWNYSNYFVKRAIWIDNNVYSLSDKKVVKSDIDSGKQKKSINLK